MAKPALRLKETPDELILNMDEELFNYKKMSMLAIVVGVCLLCIYLIGLIPIAIGVYRINQLNNRPEEVEYDIRRRAEQKSARRGKRLTIIYNPEGQQFYRRTRRPRQPQAQYTPYTTPQVETKSSFCPNCGAEVSEGFKHCMSCGARL
ncbi:MAG: zinc ribbon domain-containing protein [Promethearchaeota archaeon]